MAEMNDREETKDQIISLFELIESSLKSEDFPKDLRKELKKYSKDYLEVLEKRKIDMGITDHGIVIAGETSAGKSTLINKILGRRIFKGRNNESTSTICKLRNSEKMKIIIEHSSGEKKTIDLPDGCEHDSDGGTEKMRNALKSLTDMTSSKDSKKFCSVDITLPIPFLKGNSVLVDTPGIGGSGDVTQKLMEYLPNAVSFIFVINVASAGGLQNDRLPEIMRKLTELQMNNDMPCFDTKDVLFITNKWDSIRKRTTDSSDSSEEDEQTKTWKALTESLKDKWPSVIEENIFKLNLKDVSEKKNNSSTMQFREFQKKLNTIIEKADNIRAVRHLSFLEEILQIILDALRERQSWTKMSEENQLARAELFRQMMRHGESQRIEAKRTLYAKITELEIEIAEKTYKYMSEGKWEVLNPNGRTPMLKVTYTGSDSFKKEINNRVALFVRNFLQSRDISSKFEEVQKQIELRYIEICKILSPKENHDEDEKKTNQKVQTTFTLSEGSSDEIPKSLLTAPLIALGVFSAPLAAVLGGVYFISWLSYNTEASKREIIDECYNDCMSQVRKDLRESSGNLLRKQVDKVVDGLLPGRIGILEERANQLQKASKEDVKEQKSLHIVEEKFISMEESVAKLIEFLNQNTSVAH